MLRWEYYNDDEGDWAVLDPPTSTLIEDAFLNGEDDVEINDSLINFNEMTISFDGDDECPLQRLTSKKLADVSWGWKEDFYFVPYRVHESELIRLCLTSGRTGVRVYCDTGGFHGSELTPYDFDLVRLCQTNVDTGNKREMKIMVDNTSKVASGNTIPSTSISTSSSSTSSLSSFSPSTSSSSHSSFSSFPSSTSSTSSFSSFPPSTTTSSTSSLSSFSPSTSSSSTSSFSSFPSSTSSSPTSSLSFIPPPQTSSSSFSSSSLSQEKSTLSILPPPKCHTGSLIPLSSPILSSSLSSYLSTSSLSSSSSSPSFSSPSWYGEAVQEILAKSFLYSPHPSRDSSSSSSSFEKGKEESEKLKEEKEEKEEEEEREEKKTRLITRSSSSTRQSLRNLRQQQQQQQQSHHQKEEEEDVKIEEKEVEVDNEKKLKRKKSNSKTMVVEKETTKKEEKEIKREEEEDIPSCPICLDVFESSSHLLITPSPTSSSSTSSSTSSSSPSSSHHSMIDLSTVPICLPQCIGHYYHLPCIHQCLIRNGKCPMCQIFYLISYGNQPPGTMTEKILPPGVQTISGENKKIQTIQITYSFPSGIQGVNHPHSGHPYSGTARYAYLPNNPEGQEILRLLKICFERKLTFMIGTSISTGQQNTVVWNGVHHKTSISGGTSNFGYPDPDYFRRVKEELKAKGIE